MWTTDAASSTVIKFRPDGTKLLEIVIGGQPTPCRNNFCSTTDIAFAKDGHLFISDGYVLPNGELLVGPGPDAKAPQWFRKRD